MSGKWQIRFYEIENAPFSSIQIEQQKLKE